MWEKEDSTDHWSKKYERIYSYMSSIHPGFNAVDMIEMNRKSAERQRKTVTTSDRTVRLNFILPIKLDSLEFY